MIIDTHAHLDFPAFAEELPEVVARAEAAGVTRIISIGTTIEGSRNAVALAERFPNVYAAVGIHPNCAHEVEANFIHDLRQLARHPRVVAIGEIGTDYFRLPEGLPEGPTASLKAKQAEVFQAQLELAVELGLNVVIHEREAWEATLEILQPFHGKLRSVFHCFGKSLEQAQQLLDFGHLVSFTGIVTFKNAAIVQHAAKHLPANAFMVETDCPYLAPVPHRGKRCEPAHTRLVAEFLAQLRATSLQDIASQTTATAQSFFRFTPLP